MWSFYITILVVGIIPRVYMETCPDEEEIYPCSCKESHRDIMVTCSRGFFNTSYPLQTLRQSLSELTGKSGIILHLEGFNISIPSNFFAGFGIKGLKFHSCRIENVTNDGQPALLGLENHLEGLHIYNCSTFPEKLDLGHLKKLNSLGLQHNNITELSDEWLGNVPPPSLYYLSIKENNITKIGSHVFSQLNDLRLLFLNHNRFGAIQRSMLPTTARNLQELYLENNGITDLPVDIFERMPAIHEVSLARNGITTLDESTWLPIWQRLSTLKLYYTNIICDDKLKWILKSKLRPKIYGRCSNPREWEGNDVEDFLKSLKH